MFTFVHSYEVTPLSLHILQMMSYEEVLALHLGKYDICAYYCIEKMLRCHLPY
jgi:hypothetical protein